MTVAAVDIIISKGVLRNRFPCVRTLLLCH